jgi:hypothetical protein
MHGSKINAAYTAASEGSQTDMEDPEEVLDHEPPVEEEEEIDQGLPAVSPSQVQLPIIDEKLAGVPAGLTIDRYKARKKK